MKDYASMSDREINMHVASIIYHESTVIESRSRPPCAFVTGSIPDCWVDYCNNPADAWPIIIGQKLSLINADDEWLCVPDYATVDGVAGEDIQKIYFSYGYVDANPLRCAMIVFLMMKEGE